MAHGLAPAMTGEAPRFVLRDPGPGVAAWTGGPPSFQVSIGSQTCRNTAPLTRGDRAAVPSEACRPAMILLIDLPRVWQVGQPRLTLKCACLDGVKQKFEAGVLSSLMARLEDCAIYIKTAIPG